MLTSTVIPRAHSTAYRESIAETYVPREKEFYLLNLADHGAAVSGVIYSC